MQSQVRLRGVHFGSQYFVGEVLIHVDHDPSASSIGTRGLCPKDVGLDEWSEALAQVWSLQPAIPNTDTEGEQRVFNSMAERAWVCFFVFFPLVGAKPSLRAMVILIFRPCAKLFAGESWRRFWAVWSNIVVNSCLISNSPTFCATSAGHGHKFCIGLPTDQ